MDPSLFVALVPVVAGRLALEVGISSAIIDIIAGVFLMLFVGRTGPLTLGFALAARAKNGHVTYPPEKIMIG